MKHTIMGLIWGLLAMVFFIDGAMSGRNNDLAFFCCMILSTIWFTSRKEKPNGFN
jgi:hypothetical protein